MIGTPDSSETMQTELSQMEERLRTLVRVSTTPYPVAQTPREAVWRLNKATLYRYTPVVPPEERHPVPLLLVFALMNRPSILDLYLLDWGIPGPEDKNLTFDDYVLDYMPRAIRKLKSVSGSQEFSLLGWCIGAILTTMYAALRPNDGLKNLLLLTAPLDFEDRNCGTFIKWVDERYFDVDGILRVYGNMPGELLDYGAKALKPVENYVQNYLRLWDNLDDPRIVESWHSMNTWVTDLTPMAGATFRQLIVDLYRNNRLMKGTMTLRGERVDLKNIQASVLNLVAEQDHIVPPGESVGVLSKIASEDKELLRIPGGHIGVMAGSAAVKRTWPRLEAWLEPRSGKPAG